MAQATHDLSWEACAEVDQTLSGFVPMVAWPRFRRLLTAAVLQADPDARRAREEAARATRGVWSFAGEDGLRTIVAKAAAGDVRWFVAAVDRIAEILRLDGDTDLVDAHRAKAIGIVSQPALALQLLTRHAADADPRGQETPETVGATDAAVDDLEDQPSEEGDPSLDLTSPMGLSSADLRRARPRVVLHLHLTDSALRAGDGLVRPEHGDPLTLDQVREWLAETGCPLTVRPVVDPVETAPIDGYEIPYRLREAVFLRNPVDVFPFGNATSRTLDLDHSTPFIPLERGGPPGQTGQHNLGPFTRSHHRAVTFVGWRRRQPSPGTYLFRSPDGHVFLTTNHGTLTLGRTPVRRPDPAGDPRPNGCGFRCGRRVTWCSRLKVRRWSAPPMRRLAAFDSVEILPVSLLSSALRGIHSGDADP